MEPLVSLAMAREHLRLDYEADSGGTTGPDDGWLGIFIPAISEAVATWVKVPARLYVPDVDSSGEPVIDSDGEPVPRIDSDGLYTVRPVVVGAVLVELASVFRYREGEGKDNVVTPDAGYGYVLNKTSTAMLAALRRPTLR